MDRETHAASRKIDHLTLNAELITIGNKASVDIDSTLLHRPIAVGTYAYVHDDAQTPFGRFVVDIFIQASLL